MIFLMDSLNYYLSVSSSYLIAISFGLFLKKEKKFFLRNDLFLSKYYQIKD